MENRTFRLFISSTFRDFMEERNLLTQQVQPALERLCAAYGYHFQLIDLRWGVTTQSALDQRTMDICLKEVDRCLQVSPRPNFLLMIGSQYGWIPLPAHISPRQFQSLWEAAAPAEQEFLGRWYVLDQNQIGGEYCLRPRNGPWLEDARWQQEEDKLRALLQRLQQAIPPAAGEPFMASATELEIWHGLLHASSRQGHTLAFFRTETGVPIPDSVARLRNQVRQRLSADGQSDALTELTVGPAYQQQFVDWAIQSLSKRILAEMQRIETQMKRLSLHQASQELLHTFHAPFYGRSRELDLLAQELQRPGSRPLCLLGASGSGKSTLLMEAALHFPHPDDLFFLFYGLEQHSYRILDGVQQLSDEISQRYGLQIKEPLTYRRLGLQFSHLLKQIPADQHCVVLIDAAEMFQDIGLLHTALLPETLPPQVQVLFSTTDHSLAQRLCPQVRILPLDDLETADREEIFLRLLAQRGRCLDAQQLAFLRSTAFSQPCSPLYLQFLAILCSHWRSGTQPETPPPDLKQAAIQVIHSMYRQLGHDETLVQYALSTIVASPYGLAEEDLQTVLLQIPQVRVAFAMEDRYDIAHNRLPFVVWSRLFWDLDGALQLVPFHGILTVRCFHAVFAQAIQDLFAACYTQAQTFLIRYYTQLPVYLDAGERLVRTGKVFNLPSLLRRTRDLDALARLYQPDFADASVQLGELEHMIDDLLWLKSNGQHSRDALLACLQQNQTMLQCYRDAFPLCADAAGLQQAPELPLRLVSAHPNGNGLPFPFRKNVPLIWSPSGAQYAVWAGPDVFFYQLDSQTEYLHLSLHASDSLLHQQAVWPRSDLFVLAYGASVYVYQLEANSVQLLYHLDGSLDSPLLHGFYCDPQLELLFLLATDDTTLMAYHLTDGQLLYSIKTRFSTAPIVFSSQFVIVLNPVRSPDLFSIADGQPVQDSPLQASMRAAIAFRSILFLSSMPYRLLPYPDPESTSFIVTPVSFRFDELPPTLPQGAIVIHPDSPKTRQWFLPPDPQKLRCQLSGLRSIVYGYSSLLLWLDLPQRRFYQMPFSDPIQLSWVHPDETLSVLTEQGMFLFKKQDFAPVSQEVSSFAVDPFAWQFRSSTHLLGAMFHSYFFAIHHQFYLQVTLPLKQLFLAACITHPWLSRLPGQDSSFSFILTLLDGSSSASSPVSASLRCTGPSGSYAVAYERAGCILVYHPNGRPRLELRPLGQTLNRHLQKMYFSSDEQFLLVQGSSYLTVYHLSSGRPRLRAKLPPFLDCRASFSDDSASLTISVPNRSPITVSLARRRRLNLSRTNTPLVPALRLASFLFMIRHTDTPPDEILSDMLSLLTEPETVRLGFSTPGVYRCSTLTVILNWVTGTLTLLQQGRSRVVESPLLDLRLSLKQEDLSALPFDRFLQEKNDSSSVLIDLGQAHYLLVSRLLNSVFLLDAANARILAAYKHHGPILDARFADGQLTLFSNTCSVQMLQIRQDWRPKDGE